MSEPSLTLLTHNNNALDEHFSNCDNSCLITSSTIGFISCFISDFCSVLSFIIFAGIMLRIAANNTNYYERK